VIADIHFQPKYIFAAIDAGCAAVRVNPGNIKEFDGRVKEVAKAAGAAGIPIRIGVNAGSLDKRMMEKYGKATPEALVESALWEASLFEEHGSATSRSSVKHNDPWSWSPRMSCWPRMRLPPSPRRHRGRPDVPGHDQVRCRVRCPVVQGHRRHHPGIAVGTAHRRGQGRNQILESLNLRPRGLEIVSCPSCGRAQVDVYTLANAVTADWTARLPLRVAVMGCVVNGPGEAREADLGVASGNGKGQIFVKGEVIKTVRRRRS